MSSLKPIILYTHGPTPNPRKVRIILEELGLPYDQKPTDIAEVKQEPYTSLNPNGRLPTIEDPNTGITIWESGAIIQYLIETYDKKGIISYSTTPEKHHLNQWLHFQMSGQGPYFGQAAWFQNYHPEKLPSAIERYQKEVERVTGVLDKWLSKHPYLVGDKVTYADLSFVPWATGATRLAGEERINKGKFPAYFAWLEELLARPSVKTSLEL